MSSPLDDIRISKTASEKQGRYLTPSQLRTALREHSGYVCRRTSPNHDGLYDENRFLLRGTFFDTPLDIVFAVEDDHVTVVTQMSQHANSVKGYFYQRVGETAADAIAWMDD